MIPVLLLGGLLVASVVAITFWDQIKKYLSLAFERVKKVITATIVGVAAYVQTGNLREGIKAAYKFYSKNERGMWQESVVTKEITAEELPEHIRKKLEKTDSPVDISNELELKLK